MAELNESGCVQRKLKHLGEGYLYHATKPLDMLNRLIQSGRLTLCEPCAPNKLDVHMQVPAPPVRVNRMFCPRPSVSTAKCEEKKSSEKESECLERMTTKESWR